MKNKAFTLLELLMVVAVMGMLGTVATAGYYAAVSNMEIRGAKDAVTSLLRSAQQRAATDHVPTGVLFYNQLLRASSVDNNAVVVGVAVAVRAGGRVSCVVNDKYLFDEFNDINFGRRSLRKDTKPAARSAIENNSASVLLYRIDMANDKIDVSAIRDYVVERDYNSGACEETPATIGGVSTNVSSFAFYISDASGIPSSQKTANGKWRAGDLYGYEIATIQLPHNMVFGDSDGAIPRTIDNPVKSDPVKAVFFKTDGKRKGSGTVKMATCRTKDASGQLRVDDKFQTDSLDENNR